MPKGVYKRKQFHGMSHTITYRSWTAMIQRCYHDTHPMFRYYGGRHPHPVTVCDEWRYDFLAFYQDMGPRPSLAYSLDRQDNALGYCPSNVQWATRHAQHRHRDTNVWITIGSETKIKTDWIYESPISKYTIRERLRRGWSFEDAITKPPQQSSHQESLVRIGDRFGFLTVQERGNKRRNKGSRHPGSLLWLCVCDCGKTCQDSSSNLRQGKRKSCGCRGRTLYLVPGAVADAS